MRVVLWIFASLLSLSLCSSARATTLDPSGFNRRLSRQDMEHLLGRCSPVDSFLHSTRAKGTFENVVVYAPVLFDSIPSIVQVAYLADSVVRTDIYLPYHEHKGLTPLPPYTQGHYVEAGLGDLERIRQKLVAQLGEPAISGDTFFMYEPTEEHPSMSINFANGMILVSISRK